MVVGMQYMYRQKEGESVFIQIDYAYSRRKH